MDSGVPPQQQLKDLAADLAAPTKQHKGRPHRGVWFAPRSVRRSPCDEELVCKNWVQVNPTIYQFQFSCRSSLFQD
jgi:hypothetical protein